jgi:tetratricopeptide (TPR) repeat protein
MENPEPIDTKPRGRWPLYTAAGLFLLALIAVSSGLSGYRSGIELLQAAQATAAAHKLDEQYRLGVQELSEGNYDLARQRFEYVIRFDPGYPGAQDHLALAMVGQMRIATPTTPPTAAPSPTPDLRGAEELYLQARQNILNISWTEAIDALLRLRKAEPGLHPVEVDGMLFLALRNRGLDKILALGELEEGLYDLALAERFGPLDADARGYMGWARMYITGASFWELNWAESVSYFSQVALMLPNLRDGSGMTARERYRQALIGYGGALAQAGLPCEAQAQYELSMSLGALGNAESEYQAVVEACILSLTPTPDPNATPEPEPGEDGESTPEPGTDATPDPEATPTALPEATPTP